MLMGSESVKAASRTLMKLSPGVNFTNVLSTAFTFVDPESVKKYSYVIGIFLRFRDLQT